MADFGAELTTQLDLAGGAGGGDHVRTGVGGELDRGRAGSAGAGVDQHVSPAWRSARSNRPSQARWKGTGSRPRRAAGSTSGMAKVEAAGQIGVLGEATVGALR